MVLSSLAFALMGAAVKAVPEVPLEVKVGVRNLITLVVAAVLVRRHPGPALGRWRHQPHLLARSLLGVGGVACYFYAIDHLVLADATMLTRLSPYVVAVLAALLLAEPLSGRVLVAMTVAFAGGLLVIKPRFDLEVVPALVGLASAFFAGGAYTTLRALRHREPAETVVLHFSLTSVVAMAPLMAFVPRRPSAEEAVWLLVIGLCAAAGQIWLTAAYRHAPAAEVSVYGSTMILFAAVMGFAGWGEIPDAASIAGGALIVVGSWLAFRRGPRGPATMADAPGRAGGPAS